MKLVNPLEQERTHLSKSAPQPLPSLEFLLQHPCWMGEWPLLDHFWGCYLVSIEINYFYVAHNFVTCAVSKNWYFKAVCTTSTCSFLGNRCKILQFNSFCILIFHTSCLIILFFNFINSFIYFWLRWVFVAVRGLSLVVASGDYSSLRCVDFSLWWLLLLGARALGTQASVVARGLSSSGSWALERRLSSCGAWA